MDKKRTLRQQFNSRLIIILISITVVTGVVQFFLIRGQVGENVEREAGMIAQSIEQGISETDLASKEIEQQINYKLEMATKQISSQLPSSAEKVSSNLLNELRNQVNLTGLDIFAYDENGIISVVKSTEPEEVGFTLNGISDEGYAEMEKIMNGEVSNFLGQISYTNGNTIVLQIAQSGSREEPQFFKYAYHKEPGTNFILSTFIEANEVNQFTEKVGPNSWISKVQKEYENAKEIAVLDPRVFADPSLAEKMYPPLQKVVYGKYDYETDEQLLIDLVDNPRKVTTIDKHDGKKIYKTFIPYDDGRVIYVAMDYDKMAAPFTRYSLILIAFGFVSLLILFLTTTRFFNGIYNNISRIIEQIKSLEKGDFKARSNVNDRGELGQLSQSTNRMADTLNDVLSQTKEQAVQTERHSYLLESEANNSVEKVYTMSMETTTESRENTDEIYYLIEEIEKGLAAEKPNEDEINNSLMKIKELVQSQSTSTTEMTITLSDLLKSLHDQSSSLSGISKKLLNSLEKFDLKSNMQNEE